MRYTSPLTAGRRSGRNLVATVAAVLALAGAACSHRTVLWEDRPMLTGEIIDAMLGLRAGAPSDHDLRAEEVPEVPVRRRLRPCCAFGHSLRAEVGPIPVPGLVLQNIIGIDELGKHRFDAGVSGADDPEDDSGESNGLVYTCRAGFIDTAHVRDYADWTMFLAPALARTLETGAVLELPDEGGRRRVHLHPLPPEQIEAYGRRRLAVSLAQWTSFQMSIWHEIVTWYGWSALPLFSERASAFSPEDLYSNALGINLAAGVIAVRGASTDLAYDRNVDRWTRTALARLGAVDGELGREAADSVDGVWWDSSRRVPDERLILRRNFAIDTVVLPWTVELAGRSLPAGLQDRCTKRAWPVPMVIPEALGNLEFAHAVALEIEPDADIAEDIQATTITQEDFPAIVDRIVAAARREFGELADNPSRDGNPNPYAMSLIPASLFLDEPAP